MKLSDREKEKLEEHLKAIAKILYQNTHIRIAVGARQFHGASLR